MLSASAVNAQSDMHNGALAAFDNTTYNYDTISKGSSGECVFEFTNSLGLAVYTQTVHGLQGQDVIDTRELPVGVYVLTIRCEDHSLTEKVVVAR